MHRLVRTCKSLASFLKLAIRTRPLTSVAGIGYQSQKEKNIKHRQENVHYETFAAVVKIQSR